MRQQHQRIVLNPHQAIGDMILQPGQRLVEVLLETDAVASFQGREIDTSTAHQGADHLAPQLVVGIQAIAAMHRQQTLIDACVVRR
ncbi:hypothetical protein D3C81_1782600 [compost metagenome]